MATLDREKLYEQVWTIPGARLAMLYGLSDVGLAKVCKRYDIPRPPRGYWAKLAAGQEVKRTPLPKLRDQRDAKVQMMGWELPDELIQLAVADEDVAPPATTPDGCAPAAPHQLVEVARTQLVSAKPDQNGLLRTDPSSAPDLCISTPTVARTLAIIEALIRKWEGRGGSVRVGAEEGRRTALANGPDELYVRVYEEINENKPVSDPSRLTGRLCITLQGDQVDRRWADGKTQRLEKVVSTLVATAVHALALRKAARLDAECVARQKQRVQELRGAAAAKVDKDFVWRQSLMEAVGRWHEADRIRRYLAALRARIDEGELKPTNEKLFREWFDWAVWYADSIDPIVQARRPAEQAKGPKNTSAAELDLTARARSVVASLGVADSDALASKTQDEVRQACEGGSGGIWNEFTRTLEALRYDVSKRDNVPEWW